MAMRTFLALAGRRSPLAWPHGCGWAALALFASLAAITMAEGCQLATERKPQDELAMAEKAKAALVAFVHANPTVFGDMDADRLAGTPVVKEEESGPHVYRLGAFWINVEKRSYSIVFHGGHWIQFHDGTFSEHADGRWTAQMPRVTFGDR